MITTQKGTHPDSKWGAVRFEELELIHQTQVTSASQCGVIKRCLVLPQGSTFCRAHASHSRKTNYINLIVFVFQRSVEWAIRSQSLQRSARGLHRELLCVKWVQIWHGDLRLVWNPPRLLYFEGGSIVFPNIQHATNSRRNNASKSLVLFLESRTLS